MQKHFFYPPEFVRVGLKRFIWLLGAYFISRLFFLVWNYGMFQEDSAGLIARAFMHGVVFDIAAIFFSNAILILLWLLPARLLAQRSVALLDRVLFTIVNFIAVGLNFIDVEFVRFIGKRFSYEYLSMHQDVEEQSLSILLGYWKFLFALVILMGILVWRYPKFKDVTKEHWFSGIVWRVVAIALVVLGMRGGFGFKPLHPMDAYFVNKSEIGLLTLNTFFNVIKTRRDEEIVTQKFFPSNAEAFANAKALSEPTRPPLGIAKNFNVVVLVVESLSTEDMSAANPYPSYVPFLDELAKKSYFFKYNYANARRSIDGVPAVMCGLPALMPESIVMSEFMGDRLDCLPKILKPYGYSSWFLHGAHNGSFHFDTFSNIAGFDHFVGRNEFPYRDEKNFDPYWGVLDEPMLQYAVEVIDKAPKPIMLGVFTLSSHNPYWVPPEYHGKFRSGDNPIYEAIGYTDYSLRRFFEVAATKPWFNNTIFVISGDHTHATSKPEYMTDRGLYRVPLFIYVPGLKEKPEVPPDRITQHIDALPSVMDLLGIKLPERFLLGQSVFDKGLTPRAYNNLFSSYWYMDEKTYATYDRANKTGHIYDHVRGEHLKERPLSSDEAFRMPEIQNLLSVAQYFDQGLINNNLYEWAKVINEKKDEKGASNY